jgi:hypothetical protein
MKLPRILLAVVYGVCALILAGIATFILSTRAFNLVPGGGIGIHVTRLAFAVLCAIVAAFCAVRPRRPTPKQLGWLAVTVVMALAAGLHGIAGIIAWSGAMQLAYYEDTVILGTIWLIMAFVASWIALGTGRRSGLARRASAGIASRVIAGALAVLFGVLGFTAASGNLVGWYWGWPLPTVVINPVNVRTLVICWGIALALGVLASQRPTSARSDDAAVNTAT